MAKPIKETPVLTGKDAVAFVNKTDTAKITRVNAQERAKIRQNFARLQAIARF